LPHFRTHFPGFSPNDWISRTSSKPPRIKPTYTMAGTGRLFTFAPAPIYVPCLVLSCLVIFSHFAAAHQRSVGQKERQTSQTQVWKIYGKSYLSWVKRIGVFLHLNNSSKLKSILNRSLGSLIFLIIAFKRLPIFKALFQVVFKNKFSIALVF